MYRYDAIDKDMLADRTAEFRDQVARRLAGELTEDQFKPLRLMNGLYLQLHAYMLRIAIPYGSLNPTQLRKLAWIGAHLRQGLRPLHHPHQPAVPLDQADATRRTSWTTWPRSTCTPSRPAATASATSPPTPTPAPRPRRSTIRASGPRRSASGRPCTRNSRSCRASSRSPSPPRPRTARRPRSTTSACTCSAPATARWASR